MSITDTIENLFKEGLVELTIGISPKKTMFIRAGQIVPTGGTDTNHLQVTHQLDGDPLPELLNKLKAQVKHVNAAKAGNVLTPKFN